MKKIVGVIMVLLTLTACYQTPEQARKKLAELNIEYNQDNCYERALQGDTLVVDLFLAAGIEPGCVILGAAQASNLELVKKSLAKKPNLNTDLSKQALVMAANEGDSEVVQLLLKKGANPSYSSLVAAVQGEHIEITKILLDKGANPSRDSVNQQEVNQYRYLISGMNYSPLATAVSKENTDIIQLLLSKNVEVNDGENGESISLISAVQKGNLDIVKLLLEKGANPNSTPDNRFSYGGSSPLNIAVNNGHTEIVKLLLDNKAKLNDGENGESSSLISAVQKDNLDIVKLLLEKGANPNDGKNGTSQSLITAIQRNNPEIVKALLEKGANPNANDSYRSPLRYASRKPEIEAILVQYGAQRS